MNVRDIMCPQVHTCHASDALDSAARIMWEQDCGSVPVVDEEDRAVGVITDRDICMAAWTQGLPLREIAVSSAMSREVQACSVLDSVDDAAAIMREHRIRRVPILDEERRLAGIVTLNDIALTALDNLGSADAPIRSDDVVLLLGTVCEPRAGRIGSSAGRGSSRIAQPGHDGSGDGRERQGAGERAGAGAGERGKESRAADSSSGRGSSSANGGRSSSPGAQHGSQSGTSRPPSSSRDRRLP